jgi:hypothetical protein
VNPHRVSAARLQSVTSSTAVFHVTYPAVSSQDTETRGPEETEGCLDGRKRAHAGGVLGRHNGGAEKKKGRDW